MAEDRFAEIVILAEDRVQIRFIRSWLTRHVAHRRIRNSFATSGSGEQFVRERFAREAESHLRNSKKRGSMLIAVIDADTGDVEQHYRELKTMAPAWEGIFVFVPKRNIETWLRQLGGQPTNEVDDYKSSYRGDIGQAIAVAGQEFLGYVQSRSELGEILVRSLVAGIKEARRIPRVHEPPTRRQPLESHKSATPAGWAR